MGLTREQLSDIAVAYGLEVDRDGTKDELLPAILGAEASGLFNRPPKDPYRLVKASKNADEWLKVREFGLPMPAFEDPTPDPTPNEFEMLRQQAKAKGINCLHKTKAQLVQALQEAGQEV